MKITKSDTILYITTAIGLTLAMPSAFYHAWLGYGVGMAIIAIGWVIAKKYKKKHEREAKLV